MSDSTADPVPSRIGSEFPPRSQECVAQNVYEWAKANPEIAQFDGFGAVDVIVGCEVMKLHDNGIQVLLRPRSSEGPEPDPFWLATAALLRKAES